MDKKSGEVTRATGLLVIEVVNSNPNEDPDNESEPRTRVGERGEISPVSFKRKLRDLVEQKDGPVWQAVAERLELNAAEFEILEMRGRDRAQIKKLDDATFKQRYWDGRIFGNTFLEKEGRADMIKTGASNLAWASRWRRLRFSGTR